MRPRQATIMLAVFALALATTGGAVASESLQGIFAAANRAYYEGNHRAAIAGYRRLTEAGVEDADLQFNLGLACAKAGSYGHALLAFERARRLRPGDEQSERGSAAARAELRRRQADDPTLLRASRSWWATLWAGVAEDLLAWMLLLGSMTACLSLAWRRWQSASAPAHRLASVLSGGLLSIALLSTGLSLVGLGHQRNWWEAGSPAVVLRRAAELREGPDPRASVRGQVAEGAEVRWLDQVGGYALVRLDASHSGWLPASEVERVNSTR